MDCDFTERISLLIDGELSESDATEARAHLATCAACQSAQKDFLLVREEIKSYATSPDFIAQRRALRQILGSKKPPLWKRRVALPAPVFALLLFALVSLGVWVAAMRRTVPTAAEQKPAKVSPAPQNHAQDSQSGIDLARFDHGERAAIYKVKHTAEGDIEQ
ncbi:MAG TPA: zf-HC2 domain-containing protein [Pyrinomonadaceae bacterium]|nr:zf-HC2 domain-containing protein [Pyrinomonadaceae bacterium]